MKSNQLLIFSTGILVLLSGFFFQCKSVGSGGTQIPVDQIFFKKHVLLQDFIAEGVAVGDVNQDGQIDVMAGAYWFEAPNWKKHEIETPKKFEYDKGYSDAFISHGMDVNGDGWVDFVRIGFPGEVVQWFENPKNEKGHWKAHLIYPTLGNESAGFYDVD